MNTDLLQVRTIVFIKVMGMTLALASALLPALLHAQPQVMARDSGLESEYPYTAKNSSTLNTVSLHENKKQIQAVDKISSKDDSRELSAFFAIGIAINIILAVVFTWWFRKEWKKTSDPRTNLK